MTVDRILSSESLNRSPHEKCEYELLGIVHFDNGKYYTTVNYKNIFYRIDEEI
jgi:hypothetical protein